MIQSAIGCVYMLFTVMATSGLSTGLRLLASDVGITFTLLTWSVALITGTALVLVLVDEFSAVAAVSVTTVRKAFTLLASFVLFPKPLGWGHAVGAALVFGSAFVARKSSPPKHRESLLPQHQVARAL
mmetsp:Transcript_26036/g.45743  ORF Transcript_26036/g.45743 Transcript_26036/m.45743 type:complete len:128 (-) Transcript_26036:11-394(-)